jgi:hypothetical protein
MGRRRLGVMRWALRHHAAILLHHQHLRRALRGWPGSLPRLAPPGAGSPSARAPAAPWSLAGRLPERACPRPW